MSVFRLNRIVELAADTQAVMGVVWVGLVALSVALLILSRTDWGQSRPLRKCLVLSLLAHVLLAGYATTVRIVGLRPSQQPEPITYVALPDDPPGDDSTGSVRPWEAFKGEAPAQPQPLEVARAEPIEAWRPERVRRADLSGVVSETPLAQRPLAEPSQPDPRSLPVDDAPAGPGVSRPPQAIEVPAAQRRQPGPPRVGDPTELPRESWDNPAPREPSRTERAGLPSALLERPLPLPRLAHLSQTPDPSQALAAKTDSTSTISSGGPADWNPPDAEGGTLEPGPGSIQNPRLATTDHLMPPTLAGRNDSVELDPVRLEATLPIGPGPPLLPSDARARLQRQMPEAYRLRVAADRSLIAQSNGATVDSEAAVKAALQWLAANQAPDGRWDARAHGAGKEQRVAGRERFGAGGQADTGISALALLAMLASGHTHQEGDYRDHVRRGLEFLIRSQRSDGALGGQAAAYAFAYCHSMSMIALGEAYGMTGDPRLAEPVRRAVAYSVASQNRTTGGWRYNPGDEGDTSQLGWQVMGLKSAELSGIPIPTPARMGAIRYLNSVSSGSFGGIASYREGEASSRTMTAVALVSRQFLGLSSQDPIAQEAAAYLAQKPPASDEMDLYYWYYGTLGLYQTQGRYWESWDKALQATLVATQSEEGGLAGSWSPETRWGGYGGRVYSTAMATLCLEVYYRFLPLYVEAASRDRLLR